MDIDNINKGTLLYKADIQGGQRDHDKTGNEPIT
jgi:hypothetical protein